MRIPEWVRGRIDCRLRLINGRRALRRCRLRQPSWPAHRRTVPANSVRLFMLAVSRRGPTCRPEQGYARPRLPHLIPIQLRTHNNFGLLARQTREQFDRAYRWS